MNNYCLCEAEMTFGQWALNLARVSDMNLVVNKKNLAKARFSLNAPKRI
jgi:hypothetical protein